MLRDVVALWVGSALGPLQRLCLRSFVANGHSTTLYAYEDVDGLPPGVVARDAGVVVPRDQLQHLVANGGSYALFSDYFRYILQQRGAGIWVDTDVVCLRPLALPDELLFGWESDDHINAAVLALPAESPILRDSLEAFQMSRIPDWVPFRRAAGAYLRQMAGRKLRPAEMPWGTFGPKGLTALAKRHGLTGYAKSRATFYPLRPSDARTAYDGRLSLEEVLRPETLTIHLWNEMLSGLRDVHAEPGSILGSLMRRYPE